MQDINLQDIKQHLLLIQQSCQWAECYGKETFAYDSFQKYRRQVKKIDRALQSRCSIAAYGESQVGKSYLMSSLLSSASAPFSISYAGKEYSFVDDINPSGGNASNKESTGIITRFTIFDGRPESMKNYVKLKNFSVADLVMVVLDGYYNDVVVDLETGLTAESINGELRALSHLWGAKKIQQTFIEEDDIRDIEDYVRNVIRNKASDVLHSNIFDILAQNISYIGVDEWAKVFGLLWNRNSEMTQIFSKIIQEYKKINFCTDVFVPFDTVLRKNGTLLMIQWIDLVCGKRPKAEDFPVLVTDVYGPDGSLLCKDFEKSFLAVCAAEVSFVLSKALSEDRPFLEHIDLLDFPGARSRLDVREEKPLELAEAIPEILRRAKVAYLFNSYKLLWKISSVLFCHHGDQKTMNIGTHITTWVEEVIGTTPKARAEYVSATNNIPPLLMVATKFNKDLAKSKTDKPGEMSNHWSRFNDIIPEIFRNYQWFEKWTDRAGQSRPFQNIFPLRDFYWSSNAEGCSNLFDGYCDGTDGRQPSAEVKMHEYEGFPEYFRELRGQFLANSFVKSHFATPEQTWEDVATLNNDGSKAIIRTINKIASYLDAARKEKYWKELVEIRDNMITKLEPYYESDNLEDRAKKSRLVIKRITERLFMLVAENPVVFGRIIDNMMVSQEEFRKIAHSILVLEREKPKDVATINMLRYRWGINPEDGKEVNLQKLLQVHEAGSREELEELFADRPYSVEDILTGDEEIVATKSDLIVKHILDCWMKQMNKSVKSLSTYLPFTEEIVLMYKTLMGMLGVKEKMASNIKLYGTKLNAIADYASLELNNFVSSVGSSYMTKDQKDHIQEIASKIGIKVYNFSYFDSVHKAETLKDALEAIDDVENIMKKPRLTDNDMEAMRRIPMWEHYLKWQNMLIAGMILTSGVSAKDPQENAGVKSVLDGIHLLYV